MRNIRASFLAVMAFLSSLMLAPAAFAQSSSVDVTSTVASLGDVKTAVLAVGVAVLAIVVGIKLYKWVKAAL